MHIWRFSMKFFSPVFLICVLALLTGCHPSEVLNNPQNFEFEYCKPYNEAWSTTREVLLATSMRFVNRTRKMGSFGANGSTGNILR